MPSVDASVLRLLRLLGLERYAERFASEEVDLAALRLLDEDDFAQLRIPDAARRRIAEALQSVQVLVQIEGGVGTRSQSGREDEGECEEMDVVQTQRFAPSRLRKERGRRSVLAEESEGDEEFDFQSPIQRERGVVSGDFKNNSPKTGDVDNEPRSDADGLGNRLVNWGYSLGHTEKRKEEEMVRKDHSLSSGASGEIEGSDVSSLQEIECEIISTSQISLEKKLEKWLRRQMLGEKGKHRREVEKEKERHKREMEGILQRYERMSKRICSSRDLASDTHLISRVTGEATVSASDVPLGCVLGEGVSGAGKKTGSLSETKQCPWGSDVSGSALLLSPAPLDDSGSWNSVSPTARVAERDGNYSPVQQRPLSPAIDLTQNTSEEEHRVRQTPAANCKPFPNTKLLDTFVISSTKSPTKPPLGDDVLCNDSLNLSPLFKSDQSSASSPAQSKPTNQPHYESLFVSSDEEIMDLTFSEKENVRRDENRPKNSSGACANTDEIEVGVRVQNGENGEKIRARETTQATPQPPSRLKKRSRRATPSDVKGAIRRDKDLYDDILMMESIPFERILESVKASGIKIAKKALTELLQKEGVSFRLEESNEKHKAVAGSYFQRLNCNSD